MGKGVEAQMDPDDIVKSHELTSAMNDLALK